MTILAARQSYQGQARWSPLARATARAVADRWQGIVLVAYAVWVLVIGHFHEPWFDEAQSWLLARDSTLWQLFVERVRYEGTPGLWHAILWIAIHCGLPFAGLNLIAAGFAIAGAAVILWRAPFPPAMRIALLFSYFFAYQYAVIARSYSIDLLLVPLAAAFFADRAERPIRYALVVGLIANANTHGFLAAGVLGLEFAWHICIARKRLSRSTVGALLLAAGLGVFALVTAWQPSDNNFLSGTPAWSRAIVGFVANAFIDRGLLFGVFPALPVDMVIGFCLSVVLLVPAWRLIHRGGHGYLCVAIGALLTAFSSMVYASSWHSGVLFLFFVFGLWISWPTDGASRIAKEAATATMLLCAWQGVQAARTGVWDIGHNYGAGQEAAAVIRNYRIAHPHARIAASGDRSFEVQPWLPSNIFDNYHHGAPKPSFIVWAKSEPWKPHETSPEDWARLLDQHYDLVVATVVDMNGNIRRLRSQACQAGYGLKARVPGEIYWRGALGGDDSLAIFEKGNVNGCA